jgi:hypothetical protein
VIDEPYLVEKPSKTHSCVVVEGENVEGKKVSRASAPSEHSSERLQYALDRHPRLAYYLFFGHFYMASLKFAHERPEKLVISADFFDWDDSLIF